MPTPSRGRTVVDRRSWQPDISHDPQGMGATSVEVALSVDADRYAELWLETVSAALHAPEPRPPEPHGSGGL